MTVHFIGAGPGAADLLTLRAQRLIGACPVCLYAGALVPAEILDGAGGNGRIAGFRPEHIRVGSARNGAVGFEAGVEVVEYLGDEQLAHLRLGEFSLVAKLPVDERLEPGTAAAFAVAREAVLFFAAETGAATGPPS